MLVEAMVPLEVQDLMEEQEQQVSLVARVVLEELVQVDWLDELEPLAVLVQQDLEVKLVPLEDQEELVALDLQVQLEEQEQQVHRVLQGLVEQVQLELQAP